MAWFLFIDQPGTHQASMPYTALTGIAVEDTKVWTLARRLTDAQLHFFGAPLTELYAQDVMCDALLGHATFGSVDPENRKNLRAARSAPELSGHADHALGPWSDTSLAKAKIAYCQYALALARECEVAAIAMILPKSASSDNADHVLGKNYAYLIERYYFFLKNIDEDEVGLLLFSERVRESSSGTFRALTDYFVKTANGRVRAQQVLPEPVFVEQDLAALSQLSELFSYIVSWGLRLPGMQGPRRDDLHCFVKACIALRFSYVADNGETYWSLKYLPSLQPTTLPTRRPSAAWSGPAMA